MEIPFLDILQTLKQWSSIESPTYDKSGCLAMLKAVSEILSDMPLTLERFCENPHHAGLLRASSHKYDEKQILILCHLDTVHPLGTLAHFPVSQDDDKLYGPGIYDMKGGVALAVFAFRALVTANIKTSLPITFLFTTDEETGSAYSKAMIEAEARKSAYVLVVEPARLGGKIVTSRKSLGSYHLLVIGKSAHAGTGYQDGVSAITEMTTQLLAIESLSDYDRGITIVCGVIKGGTVSNVIPEQCEAEIDLRFPDETTAKEICTIIENLKPTRQGVTLTFTGGQNRPAFVKTAAVTALFQHAKELAKEIGFDLQEAPTSGGGSDANFTAACNIPTLDGLGIDGSGAHTLQEHGLISSIIPRTRLLAALMESLSA